MAKLADAEDLKSSELNTCTGSNPVPGIYNDKEAQV